MLKIKWIRLLEYECDMGRPSGTYFWVGFSPSAAALG